MKFYKMIYPDNRMVSEETLKSWACDAVDNNEADVLGSKSADDAKQQIMDDVRLAIEILEDLGYVTLSNKAKL